MFNFVGFSFLSLCLSAVFVLSNSGPALAQDSSIAFVGQLNQQQNSPFLQQLPRNARPTGKQDPTRIPAKSNEPYQAQTNVGRMVDITDFSEEKEAAILKLPNVRYGVQSLRQAIGG